jgi:hypothetical protein
MARSGTGANPEPRARRQPSMAMIARTNPLTQRDLARKRSRLNSEPRPAAHVAQFVDARCTGWKRCCGKLAMTR